MKLYRDEYELLESDKVSDIENCMTKYIKEHNFKSYYCRYNEISHGLEIDFGSHTHFFYITDISFNSYMSLREEEQKEKEELKKFQKQIFIINGHNCVGKDTFVNLIDAEMNIQKEEKRVWKYVWNYSSVTKVKEIAKQIGWSGSKNEKDRKFLSDLKLLTTDYNDMSYNAISDKIEEFQNDENALLLFIHVREPKDIKRLVDEFSAKTILIVNNRIEQVTSNMADANVENYIYDFIIANNGTLDDLRKTALDFLIQENFIVI